eukprot:7130384-Ditylum_brightwellii.AAC.1
MRLIQYTIYCLFCMLAVHESQAEAVQNGKTNDISKIESNDVIKVDENRRRLHLDPMLSFDYMVNEDNGTVTFTVEVAKSDNWIGFGTSQNGGMMYGSEVVIGRPTLPEGASNPSKYRLNTHHNVRVNDDRLPDSQQTLIDPSITSKDGKTILQFTKLLSEPGEIPIDGNGENMFVWAYGPDRRYSRLSQHTSMGSSETDLSLSKVPDSTDRPFKATESISYKGLWKVHGILAVIAWGVLVPTAISVSLLRDLYPSSFPWLKRLRRMRQQEETMLMEHMRKLV